MAIYKDSIGRFILKDPQKQYAWMWQDPSSGWAFAREWHYVTNPAISGAFDRGEDQFGNPLTVVVGHPMPS